jgi:hypothetical protein
MLMLAVSVKNTMPLYAVTCQEYYAPHSRYISRTICFCKRVIYEEYYPTVNSYMSRILHYYIQLYREYYATVSC